jgi:hypothetical protein
VRVVILRQHYEQEQVLGVLLVLDGLKVVFQGVCLEPPWLNNQKYISCIPEGQYSLKFEYSHRFKMSLWEFKGVDGRAEVKFHIGNKFIHTQGCPLVAYKVGDIDNDGVRDVLYSKRALENFHKALAGHSCIDCTIYG